VNKKYETEFSDSEIVHRMETGIRRALSTPPKPTRELVGKTERAKKLKKARRAKRKEGAAS